MIIRMVDINDVEDIIELNKSQEDFRIINFKDPIIDRIVTENSKIIAYGITKRMAEAIILVNYKASIFQRAKAMRELMNYAEYGAVNFGCDQLHCFVKNEKLATTLIKHFNFVKSRDIVLVKNL